MKYPVTILVILSCLFLSACNEKNIYGLADINLGCDPECPPDIPVFYKPDDTPQYIKANNPKTWPNTDKLENGHDGIIIYGKMRDWYQIRFYDVRHVIEARHIRKFYPYPSINSHLMFNNPSSLFSEPNEKSQKVTFSEADLEESHHNFVYRVLDKSQIDEEWWIKVDAYIQLSDCSRIVGTGWMKISTNKEQRAILGERYCTK